MIYGRKLALILVSIFFSSVSVQAQAFSTFLILLIAYKLQLKAQPFENEGLNNLEGVSLLSSLSITFMGMFLLSGINMEHNHRLGGSKDWLTICLLFIAMGYLLLFYGKFGFMFGKIVIRKIKASLSRKHKKTEYHSIAIHDLENEFDDHAHMNPPSYDSPTQVQSVQSGNFIFQK